MSDIASIVGAYPRIHAACRPRTLPLVDAPETTLTDHQSRIVRHLDDVDPVMVTELADFLGVAPSTMSLNLSRLERAGVVRRERDPADRRVVNVRLTDVGVRARDARSMLDPERVAAALRRLDPSDRAAAVRGLLLLAEAADALVAGKRHHGDTTTEEEGG